MCSQERSLGVRQFPTLEGGKYLAATDIVPEAGVHLSSDAADPRSDVGQSVAVDLDFTGELDGNLEDPMFCIRDLEPETV